MAEVDCRAGKGVSQIAEGIWWVGRGDWGGLPPLAGEGGNVYLIRGGRRDVLVDAGCAKSVRPLEKNIRAAGGRPQRVGEIWLTHSHWDHSAGAGAWVKAHPACRIRMSGVGARFLRRGDMRLSALALVDPKRGRPIPQKVGSLKPGQSVRCGPLTFEVVSLPGHAPDCLGFRGEVAGLDVMFTGDAIIGDQGAVKGCIGWLDGLWLSDAGEYERTLISALEAPPQLILPGHGQPLYGPAVRTSIRHCLWRIRKLLAIPDLHSMMPVAGRR